MQQSIEQRQPPTGISANFSTDSDSVAKSDWSQQLFKNKPTILLVEDSLILKKMAETILQDLGCQVLWAGTGCEALQLFKTGPDLILLDLGLPDISGLTVAAAIRNEERLSSHLSPSKLVAFTTSFELEKECFEAGMNDFCKKPATVDQLAAVLQKWLT